MKKGTVVFCMLFLSFDLMAQTKITKDGIIGKWVVSSVEIKDLYSYDLIKDSIILSDTIKQRSLQVHITTDSLINMIKPNVKMYHEMFYQFNVGGTGEIYYGQGPASFYKITYTIDEEKSTFTIVDRYKKSETCKAEMIQDQLGIFINQTPQDGGMSIHMILHKSR